MVSCGLELMMVLINMTAIISRFLDPQKTQAVASQGELSRKLSQTIMATYGSPLWMVD